MTEPFKPLAEYFKREGAMSPSALAELLGVTEGRISQIRSGDPPNAAHVLKIEAATGISRHDLRPDIFGERQPESQAA